MQAAQDDAYTALADLEMKASYEQRVKKKSAYQLALSDYLQRQRETRK